MNIIILGLSITSSWGNGHATTYRALVRALHTLGHHVLFLERDQPWYAEHRDLPSAPYCDVAIYHNLSELRMRHGLSIAEADLVIVGSFVPDGVAIGEWVTEVAGGTTAFYDIDTPVTLAALKQGQCDYLVPELIPSFDIYLSFTGGPILAVLEHYYRAQEPVAFHCSVDPQAYRVLPLRPEWDLGYLGTYSTDRQPALERMLLEPAESLLNRRFVVAGSLYPKTVEWPTNVQRIAHLPPHEHCRFYNRQRYTLNITRDAMVRAGYSPSVRLFEAAACGTPIISDRWPGIETFFEPGHEILIAEKAEDVEEIVNGISEAERQRIGSRARSRVLDEHSAAHRAKQLETLVKRRLRRATRGTDVATEVRS
jgi:spore maturation protein CgeB